MGKLKSCGEIHYLIVIFIQTQETTHNSRKIFCFVFRKRSEKYYVNTETYLSKQKRRKTE